MESNKSFKYLLKMIDLVFGSPQEEPMNGLGSNVNLNISEPVISFLKCFKNNPKRFNIRIYGEEVIAEDKKLSIVFIYSEQFHNFIPYEKQLVDLMDTITLEEFNFLKEEMRPYFEQREVRYEKILQFRRKRDSIKLRGYLTKVYQEENKLC